MLNYFIPINVGNEIIPHKTSSRFHFLRVFNVYRIAANGFSNDDVKPIYRFLSVPLKQFFYSDDFPHTVDEKPQHKQCLPINRVIAWRKKFDSFFIKAVIPHVTIWACLILSPSVILSLVLNHTHMRLPFRDFNFTFFLYKQFGYLFNCFPLSLVFLLLNMTTNEDVNK